MGGGLAQPEARVDGRGGARGSEGWRRGSAPGDEAVRAAGDPLGDGRAIVLPGHGLALPGVADVPRHVATRLAAIGRVEAEDVDGPASRGRG